MRGLLVGVLLILCVRGVSAQVDTPPAISTFRDFFTNARLIESRPVLDLDNVAGQLLYSDGESWQTVDYPANVTEFHAPHLRPDGTYLLATEPLPWRTSIHEMRVDDDSVLIFNPATRNFTQPQTRCGRVAALPGEGVWVVDEYYVAFLCNTETGERSDRLPPSVGENPCTYPATGLDNAEITASPDGNFVLIIVCSEATVEEARSFTVYAYNRSTQDITHLGTTTEPIEVLWFSRWLDDTHLALRAETGGGTFNWRSVYVADVTQSNSLQRIAESYVTYPQIEEAHVLWMEDNGATYRVSLWDLTTNETSTIFEDDCLILPEFGCRLSLPKLNPEGSRLAALFSEPLSVSPKALEVRNTDDGTLLYEAKLTDSGYVIWLDDDTLLLFNVTFDIVTGNRDGWRVDFTENEIVETVIPRVYGGAPLSPSGNFVLQYTIGRDDETGAIDLLTLDTGEITPLHSHPPGYDVQLSWEGEDLLRAWVMRDGVVVANWLLEPEVR